MTHIDINIQPLECGDLAQVSELHALAFGPGRFARTAYRVREGAEALSAHCQGAWSDGTLIGSVTLTAITVDGATGHWLLGPLAVQQAQTNRGLGQRIVDAALQSIAATGSAATTVILVGDLGYYERLGFEAVPRRQIDMPGPVDRARLLVWRGPDGKREVPAGMIRAMSG